MMKVRISLVQHKPGTTASGCCVVQMSAPCHAVLCCAALAAVEALVAVASRPVGVTHIWALHGLWLVAGAAGVAYAAHVKQSLQLALELLVRRTLTAIHSCIASSFQSQANYGGMAPWLVIPLLVVLLICCICCSGAPQGLPTWLGRLAVTCVDWECCCRSALTVTTLSCSQLQPNWPMPWLLCWGRSSHWGRWPTAAAKPW